MNDSFLMQVLQPMHNMNEKVFELLSVECSVRLLLEI
jgi:hypothetical protein